MSKSRAAGLKKPRAFWGAESRERLTYDRTWINKRSLRTPESLDPNKQPDRVYGRRRSTPPPPRNAKRPCAGRNEGGGGREGGALTCRLVVDEAAADGEEEVLRDGHTGDEVLVYERLVLQLLVLRHREGRRPRRPPSGAHGVLLVVVLLLRVGLPHPAKGRQRKGKLAALDACTPREHKEARG